MRQHKCQESAAPSSVFDSEYDQEWRRFRLLKERVAQGWSDVDILQEAIKELRQRLPHWSSIFPVDWQGRKDIEDISSRIAALLRHQREREAELVSGGQAAVTKATNRTVPGVPEWPAEAMKTAAVALANEQFTYTKGVLSFLGYRVGVNSKLTAETRRRILAYALLGPLPQVNDRHYMREWGRPKTSARLRKLANVLAAFARNARRRNSPSWQQAIEEWEQDLAFLKRRYYDRRNFDWKWPQTKRRNGRS